MKTLKWSRLDKKRAQAILKQVAEHYGGWQGLADALEMDSDSSRQTVQAWHRRGRVPLVWVQPLRTLAAKHAIPCTLGDLSPQAKHMEKIA